VPNGGKSECKPEDIFKPKEEEETKFAQIHSKNLHNFSIFHMGQFHSDF
jgi:hypothetical protein